MRHFNKKCKKKKCSNSLINSKNDPKVLGIIQTQHPVLHGSYLTLFIFTKVTVMYYITHTALIRLWVPLLHNVRKWEPRLFLVQRGVSPGCLINQELSFGTCQYSRVCGRSDGRPAYAPRSSSEVGSMK